VKGIGCQAGQMIFGAGWLALRGCEANRAFWTTLPLHKLSQRSNRCQDTEKWSSLTLSSHL
jgi:hypothetical protein